jgi:hypothetical protein
MILLFHVVTPQCTITTNIKTMTPIANNMQQVHHYIIYKVSSAFFQCDFVFIDIQTQYHTFQVTVNNNYVKCCSVAMVIEQCFDGIVLRNRLRM